MRALILFILLVFLIILSEQLKSQRAVYSAWSKQNSALQSMKVRQKHAPNLIIVDDVFKIPVETGELQNGEWPESQDSAIFLTNSAYPGFSGNTIIYAHNWPELFGKLQDVHVDQVIRLAADDGIEWSYRIESMQEVGIDETEWLQPTTQETLTLYTCSGILDRKRLVVRAVPVFK